MITKQKDTLFGHPKGLYICFATEMWERFSFYGMKYLLLLYLTKYHLFTDAMGLDVLGSYAALVYSTPVIGGLLADRYLGMRKAVIFGGCLLVLGHLGMAVEGSQAYFQDGEVIRDSRTLQIFYFSMALIIVGVGFLKPNISTIVGKLYGDNDPRRDSGFTIFYMGINIGAFVATLLCGYLGETLGWRYGFGAAGIGMLLGMAIFLYGQRHLHGHAEPHQPERLKEFIVPGLNREWCIYLGGLVSLLGIWQLVQSAHWVGWSLNGLAMTVAAGLLWFILARCNSVERGRMVVLVMLTFSTVVFWALFEQTAASMTLYADRVVDRTILGLDINASQFGALNPLFIMLLAPIFAVLWIGLSKRNIEPSTPVKFSLGIIQAGLGFGVLVIGSSFPNETGKVAAVWLILAYFLHTTGELCLSPVGLSAVTKLSVPSIVGLMMGTWFLATAYSEFMAAKISQLAAVDTTIVQLMNAQIMDVSSALANYTELFSTLFWVGSGAGVFLLLLSPFLKKYMHGIH
ncbi:MAG: peptide MFS transporter [Porticoccus sp.]|nr:peptide MFS transporter [Porticoccus sp.]